MHIKISTIFFLLLLAVDTISAAPAADVELPDPDINRQEEKTAKSLPAMAQVPDAAIALFEPGSIGLGVNKPGTNKPGGNKGSPGAKRSRHMKVLTAKLHERNAQAGAQIVFDTFDGNVLVGVIDQVERRGVSEYSWFGHLEGQPDSSFNIVVEDEVMVGNVNPVGALPFEIRYSGSGSVHTFSEVEYDGSVGCGVEEKYNRRSSTSPSPVVKPGSDALILQDSSSEQVSAADSGAFIDVLFVYTTGAETAAGGEIAIRAIVQLSVDTSNTAYSLSGVSQRIRLAGRRSTTYSETGGTFDNHLFRIRNDGDNIMDDVHTWRDDYAADLVALIVDDTDGGVTFGLAYVIGGASDEARGFSVTDQAFAASATNWSLAHELGHNMGSAHDQQQGNGGLTTYAVGHPFNGDTQGSIQTIMARRILGGTRIQRFSNPSVNFDGQPTGIVIGQANEADNRSAFAVSDSNVGNYRSELPDAIWVDFDYVGQFYLGTFTYPFRYITQAEDQVRWNGTIFIKASSRTGGSTYTLGADRAYKIDTYGGTTTLQ